MLLLRLLGFLALLTVGASLVIYMLSGNRRYLRFAWRVLGYSLLVAALVVGFIFLERFIL